MNEQKHRVALFRPWEKIDAGDRWLALETAAEIIFCDKSAVVRSGEGWKPNYSRMKQFSGRPEADKFVLSLHAAATVASRRWAR